MILEDNTYLNYDVLNYPIRAINSDTYNLWVRFTSNINDSLEIEILIDGNISKTISTSTINPSGITEWFWINTTIVLPDNRSHIMGIKIKGNYVAIDKIVIDEDDSFNPLSNGPDYGVSPYLTTHMRVYDSVDDMPLTPLYIYDHKNSITEVVQDDWYNFDIKVLDSNHGYTSASDFIGNYFLVMSTTGSSTDNFIIWELVNNDEYNASPSAILFQGN